MPVPMPVSSSASSPFLLRYLSNALLGFAGAHAFMHFLGYPVLTDGPSMLPTLYVRGDWIWVSTRHRRGRGVRVGDAVALRHPLFPDEYASKRVVGLAGDFVLRDTPDAAKGGGQGMMVQIPEGHCWIAGDNSPGSRDSRDYGPIPLALIRGKVVARIFPWRRVGWMENTIQPVREDGV